MTRQVAQAILDTAVQKVLDPKEYAIRLDDAIRLAVQEIGRCFLDLARLAQEVEKTGAYARFGFASAGDYFQQRFGVRPRTLARYHSVLEALAYLPGGQIQEARLALTGLGIHKAAVLAPLFQTDQAPRWPEWVAFAEKATEEALQEHVSTLLGAKPRGSPSAPGERWFRALLQAIPEDAKAEVERVFAAGALKLNPQHPLAVHKIDIFLTMIRECAVEWGKHA